MSTESESGGRGGRRRRSRAERPKGRDRVSEQPPFKQPRMRYEPTRAVSDDELEAIHQASLNVLANTGIEFLLPEARSFLREAGAAVDEETLRLRFDPEMVAEYVAKAPREFTLHGRSPERNVRVGGDWIVFGPVASAPHVVTLDGRRIAGNREEFQGLVKLTHVLNTLHSYVGGYPVEPIDIHASIRHLEATYDMLTLSDKSISVYSLGRQRNIDAIEMVRIVRGIDEETLQREPSIQTVVNANSPLRYDTPMLEGILEMSARNQVVTITPFTLAGAMAPITIAGAMVQQNAEALAGITLTQAVRAGAPVVYGGFTSNVDMRSGAPAFGTPEYAKACLVGGQLARRYGLPYRSSNVSASNAVDAQAGYESVWALWGAVMGGANVLMHGAGWMEGGLHASYEKMVIDADLLNMVSAFLEPLDVSAESLAVDVIDEVGPGGHFFGTDHTQARYKTEFYSPMVSDWRNWETWEEAGSPRADQRANAMARELIASHEPPPLDQDIQAELREFVDRRISEGGIETDF
ncbi:MAG: trimethylamine methyltransferase family protein [Acidimicrobiales bacterium]